MPQYAVIATHAPSECPGANGAMREVWKKLLGEAPAVRQKHGIKPVLGPLHLDPAHKLLIVYEAPNAEALLDYAMESHFGQIMDIEFWRTTPLDELFKQAEGQPPLY